MYINIVEHPPCHSKCPFCPPLYRIPSEDSPNSKSTRPVLLANKTDGIDFNCVSSILLVPFCCPSSHYHTTPYIFLNQWPIRILQSIALLIRITNVGGRGAFVIHRETAVFMPVHRVALSCPKIGYLFEWTWIIVNAVVSPRGSSFSWRWWVHSNTHRHPQSKTH